ncbi:MAG: hypothetical protein AAGL23_14825 [Pseudomonadota bacterium]
MKPNFALTLSFDGIGLLHRSGDGWLSVGDVPLNDADLAGALKALRDTAKAQDAGDITTKLVVPNQQIRYLKFESDSRDIDILEAQVRSTLNGATPYHVSELAYDWSMTGGEVCVAAVAIETLTEAESFAVDHGFSPLSFVAVPDEGAFEGEPFFGETVHAGDVLAPGDSVDRDEDAIRVTGKIAPPEPEPEPESDPAPETAPEPMAEVAPEPEPEPEPSPVPIAGFQSARATPPAEAPKPDKPTVTLTGPTDDTPDTDAPEPDAPSPPMAFSSARRAPKADPPPAAPGLPQGRFRPSDPETEPAKTADDTPATLTEKPADAPEETPKDKPADTPPATKAPPAPAPDLPRPVEATQKTPDPAPEDLAAVAQARAETLKSTEAAPTSTSKPLDTPAASGAPKIATPAPSAPTAPPSAPTSASGTAQSPIRPPAAPSAPVSNHPGRLAFLSQRKTEPGPAATAPTTAERAQAAAKASGAAITAGISAGLKSKLGAKLGSGLRSGLQSGVKKSRGAAANLRPKAKTPSPAEQTATRAFEDERQRMTVFGARNPDNTSSESNPRFMALALTAGLLFFLVGIAAWAAIFLDGGLSSLFRSSDDVQFADDPAAIEAPEAVSTETDTDIAALPQDPVQDTEALADEPLDSLRADEPISEELSPDEARARYAATGIWQMSPTPTRPPLEGQFEDVYQTSLDPDVNFSDAVALPQVAALLPSARPATPGDPLPPGSDDVARDARGFVLATPEGTVTPDRLITIFTGPPPLVPPATPERAEPEVVEVALAPEPETVTSEDTGLRPRARPSDLSDNFERAGNGGRTLDELQSIRPRLRPQSPQEQALAEAGISPEIAEATEDGTANLFEDATEEAVTASLKPRTRPANFAQLVEQSRETAAAQPVSIEQQVEVDIPTTGSVARAATERNQIALRRLNLIGVYGSDGNRRALVRLPNGRYKKVEVGDRLDGGQVAAIGDGELRYIKRGQSVVLKMPRS